MPLLCLYLIQHDLCSALKLAMDHVLQTEQSDVEDNDTRDQQVTIPAVVLASCYKKFSVKGSIGSDVVHIMAQVLFEYYSSQPIQVPSPINFFGNFIKGII